MTSLQRQFIEDARTLKRMCVDELKARKLGVIGESTIEQLEDVIIPELDRIVSEVENLSIPPISERYLLSFANAFKVWGWDMQSPTEIYRRLVRLNQDYVHLQQK